MPVNTGTVTRTKHLTPGLLASSGLVGQSCQWAIRNHCDTGRIAGVRIEELWSDNTLWGHADFDGTVTHRVQRWRVFEF